MIIVGGGPAGLSCALMLGRCRRRVLVIDSGRYRNYATEAMHGFLTRDGEHPSELRRIGRDELKRYDIEVRCATVKSADSVNGRFAVALDDDSRLDTRKLVLATGVVDKLPRLERIDEFYGKSVHHCPYCDAWEHRDRPIAVYGRGRPGMGLAMSLKTWTEDVTLCTDGPSGLSRADRGMLRDLEIGLETAKIVRLEGEEGRLRRIVLTNRVLEREAMFFNTGQDQMCTLAGNMGCVFTHRGAVKTDRWERTNLPGLFAVGDCSRNVQWVAVAAAQGAIAAEEINRQLQDEDRARVLAEKHRNGR